MSGKKPSKPSFVLRSILVLAVLFVLLRICFGGRPSDARLVKQFNQNRPMFVELKAMIATNSPTDPLHEATSVWSMEDYRRYRTLLRQAKVIREFREGPDIRFQVAGPVASGKGYRIAVTWAEATPDRVIKSIDDFRTGSERPEHAYRSLGDGWYLWITR